jgi:hypothetical protein
MKYLILLVCLVQFSCTTVKRYKSIEKTVTDTNNLVSIDLFGTKVDAAKEDDKSKSLWELQAEGQAELIKVIDKRNAEDEKLFAALNNKYLKSKEEITTDYTAKDVRLVFSISKKRDYSHIDGKNPSYTLGDRIEYIKFNITIADSLNLNFIKWNKFSTEYATIDVADVSFSQSLEATASTGLTNSVGTEKTVDNVKKTSTDSANPSVGAKGTINKTETQKVRFRYLALNGKISDKIISIEQEGMREIDLAGNVIADINLKFDENTETLSSIESYKTPAGAFNSPDKMKVALNVVTVPVLTGLPDSINATLSYDYAYRHVSNGAKTFYEWDDEVEYIYGHSSKTIRLFSKKDYLPGFHNLAQIGQDALRADQRTRIAIMDTESTETFEMIFPSLAAAQEFRNWLIKYPVAAADLNKPIIIGNYKLLLRSGGADNDLTKRSFNSIRNNMQALKYYR